MWIVLLALALFCAVLFGAGYVHERDKDVQKETEAERKRRIAREAVIPIHQTYQEMKQDDNCFRLFSQCKADIEAYASILEDVRIQYDAVELSVYPKTQTKSWEDGASQPQKYKIKFSDFLPNGFSRDGRAAFAYWLVTEIPIMTYDGKTKDLSSFYYREFFDHDGSGDICTHMQVLYPKKPSC